MQLLKMYLLLYASLLSIGCSSAYYGAAEKLGYHKRDILVSRVESARDTQSDAKQQIVDTLKQFQELTGYQAGDLQNRYAALKTEYDQSTNHAEELHDRIDAIESVANALFAEWEQELDIYKDRNLKRDSESQLRSTRQRYSRLMHHMRQVEARLKPVLDTFQDQVLFLKHNLNARALKNLSGEANRIELDVSELVKRMETAIDEANSFVATMS